MGGGEGRGEGAVEIVGTLELVCVGRLLRTGCDSFLMPACLSVGGGEPLWEQNGLLWEHSGENQWGEERQRQKAYLGRGDGGRGGGRDRKPNFVACGARIVSWWVVVM